MRGVWASAVLAATAYAASSPVRISLETGWEAPPILLEILEVVYDEAPSAYFPLLNLLSSHLPHPSPPPALVLTTALDLISTYNLLPKPSSLSTFNLALSLHTAVPRLEAYYSWYRGAVDEEELDVGGEGCGSWVEWRGKGFCEADELRKDIEMSLEDGTHHSAERPRILPFDHISPSTSSIEQPLAVLYYDPSSSGASSLITYLEHHATTTSGFQYIVRYRPSQGEGRRTGLSGYGVEMALKKTDYLVVDDRATGGAVIPGNETHSRAAAGRGIFSDALGEDPWSELSTPIAKEELTSIGVQAASLIMSSSKPLDALLHLSQDFPKYSAAIARKVEIPQNIRSKVGQILDRGYMQSSIYINGKAYRDEELNAFSLLKIIRSERDLALSLTGLGLTPKQAFELISDPIIGSAQTEDDPGEGVVDASDRLENGEVITWWNDITKDKRYKNWPAHLQGYLRPLYPGQLHSVRQNTWNLVFVLDLSLAPSLETIAGSISSLIQRSLPLRFGVVPMFDPSGDELSRQVAKVFLYSVKTFGRGTTRDLLTQIVQSTPGTPANPGTVKLDTVRQIYTQVAAEITKTTPLTFDEVLAAEDLDQRLESISKYASRLLATKEESAPGHLFVNGKHMPMSGQWMTLVQNELTTQTTFLQESLASGNIPEDVSTFFYDLPSTAGRRSKLIIPGMGGNTLRINNLVDVFEGERAERYLWDFIYPTDESRGTPITIWVVGDLDSQEGKAVISDALTYSQTHRCASRLGFVHAPSVSHDVEDRRISTLLYKLLATSALSRIDARQLQDFIVGSGGNKGDILRADEGEQTVLGGSVLDALTSDGWEEQDAAAAAEFWRAGKTVAERLKLKSDLPHLLVNGRLVGPITPGSLIAEDFDVLEAFEHRKRVKPVIDLLKTMYDDITAFDRATLASLISTASSVIASSYKAGDTEGIFTPNQVSRNRYYEKMDDGTLSFTVGNRETAILHVTAIVDPISEQAQRWSSLIKTLSEMENVAVSVYLQPAPNVSEIKLKRFYRFAFEPELYFDIDGNEITPAVTFEDLPSSPIFTLGMDTPPSWIVSPKTSPYDLDNLQLSSIHNPVTVVFTLKQLLIEGHAREGHNVPPRGLQLQLTAQGLGVVSDTQVMANLGYFQFKATPGIYDLSIREGRGREVYEVESVGSEGWDSRGVNVTGTEISLRDFSGVTILPRFSRREGMEEENVLSDEKPVPEITAPVSIWERMKGLVGLDTPKIVTTTVTATRHADINIFTVASGLLYERFASIMILSVMKHTKSTVKFWFIENFLSPTFIAFIPHLAEEYGFQYEFVTYKWPHWLRAQTEKQRIIWAYKILFLDVLFPMDLDKVIFVDADQIVRVDMKELVDVDLHGRVYGYAPMGDDRTEMEGFRFWKTGYWKDALHGLPYHISALYVVDLKRFRQLATGDRLRGQYHALSADPNSLANLDQDLPNSMQDQIPIFTLDQDWLYCQTWCADERLATAKTIDLCQNPLTKEPKLVRARQIPEWDVYDREIAAVAARIEGEGGALAASVDELAGSKPAQASEAGGAGDTADVPQREESERIPDEL